MVDLRNQVDVAEIKARSTASTKNTRRLKKSEDKTGSVEAKETVNLAVLGEDLGDYGDDLDFPHDDPS